MKAAAQAPKISPEQFIGAACTLNHPVTADIQLDVHADTAKMSAQEKSGFDNFATINPELSIARDSDGRMRISITATDPKSKDRGTTVLVVDPVMKQTVVWGKFEKQYIETPLPPMECTSGLPDFTKFMDLITGEGISVTRLPDKQLNHLPAVGFHIEEKAKATPHAAAEPGATGAAEIWFSPDVGLPVEGYLEVPAEKFAVKFGLKNVHMQEPDPAQFHVPEGFTKLDVEELQKSMRDKHQAVAPPAATPAPPAEAIPVAPADATPVAPAEAP